jgi:hypothetical protein
VDENDPLGSRERTEVEIYPTDSGFTHHDRGRLTTLMPKEVTVASCRGVGGREVRIHAPRTEFRVIKVGGGSAGAYAVTWMHVFPSGVMSGVL